MRDEPVVEDYLALPSRPMFVGSDPRGLRSAISQVTANAHQMMLDEPRSDLSGVVHGVRLDRIGLVSIRYSLPIEINSRATRRRVLVVVPRAPMEVYSGKRHWFSDAPFVMGTHHGTRVVPAPGQGALVAAMDAEALEYAVETATGRRFTRPLRLTSELRPLLLAAPDLVRSAYREACRTVELSEGPLSQSLLEQHLLTAGAVGISPFLDECLAPTRSPGQGYLDVATRFIADHLGEDLSVSRIARFCGISERQLHAAFKDHLAVSPAQHVREKRLQAARRLLTDPKFAAGGTVGAAAAQVGVTHLGRFAKAYADRYEEPPSHTLTQTRARTLEEVVSRASGS